MYLIETLGPLPRGISSSGVRINQAGNAIGLAVRVSTVVEFFDSIDSFLWTPVPSLTDIGSLSRTRATFCHGMNDQDAPDVVGRSIAANGRHAFRWSSKTRMVDLTPDLPVFFNSEAWDINDAGTAVGAMDAENGELHAVLWDRNGNTSDLSKQHGLGVASARAVNDAGIIAGFTNAVIDGDFRAFVIDGSPLMLPSTGGRSRAHAINEAGAVAGQCEIGGVFHACVWLAGTHDLVDLGPGVATDLNDRGAVVGSFVDANDRLRACLWQNGRRIDLNDELLASGWVLTEANGVNNAGQIVGRGSHIGYGGRGFRLTPGIEIPDTTRLTEVIQILYGVLAGNPGIVIRPGQGPTPEPAPLPYLRAAVAIHELAAQLPDGEAAKTIKTAALKALIAEAEELLRSLK